MMDKIIYWVKHDWSEVRLNQTPLTGAEPSQSLAVPMMLLCLIDQMETMDPTLSTKYKNISEWCLKHTFMHIQVLSLTWLGRYILFMLNSDEYEIVTAHTT